MVRDTLVKVDAVRDIVQSMMILHLYADAAVYVHW